MKNRPKSAECKRTSSDIKMIIYYVKLGISIRNLIFKDQKLWQSITALNAFFFCLADGRWLVEAMLQPMRNDVTDLLAYEFGFWWLARWFAINCMHGPLDYLCLIIEDLYMFTHSSDWRWRCGPRVTPRKHTWEQWNWYRIAAFRYSIAEDSHLNSKLR